MLLWQCLKNIAFFEISESGGGKEVGTVRCDAHCRRITGVLREYGRCSELPRKCEFWAISLFQWISSVKGTLGP